MNASKWINHSTCFNNFPDWIHYSIHFVEAIALHFCMLKYQTNALWKIKRPSFHHILTKVCPWRLQKIWFCRRASFAQLGSCGWNDIRIRWIPLHMVLHSSQSFMAWLSVTSFLSKMGWPNDESWHVTLWNLWTRRNWINECR